MSLKNIFSLKSIGLAILIIFVILGCKVLWELYQYESRNTGQMQKYDMFLNKYRIQRNNLWDTAFSKLSSQQYTRAQFQQKGDSLVIDGKFVALIGHEGQHYEQKTIQSVIKLPTKSQQNNFFVVRSQVNQQLFYQSKEMSQNRDNIKEYQHLQKCLELENIELKDKIHYYIDNQNRFWMVSHPHNNVLFIQVYDCQQKRLIKKIFHQPSANMVTYLINQLISISSVGQNQYEIKLLTYETHEYLVEVSAEQGSYQISSTRLNPSHLITTQKVTLSNKMQTDTFSSLKYKFFDPLNKVFTQEFQFLILSIVRDFMDEIKTLLNGFGVSTKPLNAYINAMMKQHEKQKDPQYFDYDLHVIDEQNECVINLQYNLQQSQSNTSNTYGQTTSTLTKLAKHIIPTRTPIFHSIQNYDSHDVIQILKKKKNPVISQFKRLRSNTQKLNQAFQTQYFSDYFYSVYKTQPDNQINFLGVGQKVFYLHPTQKVKDQYLSIRSKEGGLIMQGSKLKGLYEDRPVNSEEVHQQYTIQANQVLSGVFQVQAGYRALYSQLKNNKVQLINGLNGKVMSSFSISFKQGYVYSGSYLFNNEWWIVQFNTHTQSSQLTKQELYVQTAYPKQLNIVKRTYGKFIESEFSQGQDDIFTAFNQFVSEYGNGGFVVLDIFRCIDEFYYIQIADPQGKNYGIIRVHYKRLSNRQPKKSGKYSGQFQTQLIVLPKDMVKQKQKIDPFLLVLESANLFLGIQNLVKNKKIYEWTKYTFKDGIDNKIISQLKKLNKFDFLPYSTLSNQHSNQQDEHKSTQQITLINMRVLVENAKKKFMIETKQLSRNRLKYFVIFFIIILLSIILKIVIRSDLEKIEKQKQKAGSEQDMNSPQKKKNSLQKGKNKKQKSK